MRNVKRQGSARAHVFLRYKFHPTTLQKCQEGWEEDSLNSVQDSSMTIQYLISSVPVSHLDCSLVCWMLFKLCSENWGMIVCRMFYLGKITLDLQIFLNKAEYISKMSPEMKYKLPLEWQALVHVGNVSPDRFSLTQIQESSDRITIISVRKKINNAYFAKFQVVFPLQIV